MLRIDSSAETATPAAPSRCLEVLAAAEDYPSWSSLITEVVALDEGRLRIRAELFGLSVKMHCTLEVGAEGAVLRRVPHDANDDERFEATWTIKPVGTGSGIALHTVAALDAPGPASLLKGKVTRALVDDLLADFSHAV